MIDHEEHWAGGRRPSMRPPARIQSRVALGVVALLVGFLVAVQANTAGETALSRLASERPEDLTRILAELGAEADALTQQVAALRVRLSRYRGSARSDDLAVRDARKTLEELEVLSGTVPVEGPGVTVTVSDEAGRLGWDALLDLVQELRDAGAEAIAVGGVRVLASTWLGPGEGGVVVDGRPVAQPYVIEAIGDPGGLSEALGIPGGPLSLVGAQAGVEATVEQAERLTLPAGTRVPTFVHARPVS